MSQYSYRIVDLSSWPGGSSDKGRHDIGCVPVKASPRSVVAHSGSGIRVACCFLDIAKRDARVERSGDEGVAKAVWRDALVDPSSFYEAFDYSIGAVPVHPAALDAKEDRANGALPDVEIEGSAGSRGDGNRDVLAAFADNRQRAMASLGRQIANIGIEHFRDPQAVQRQQRDEGTVSEITQTSLYQQRSEFVAIQAQSSRLGVDFVPANIGGGVLGDDVFDLAVLVERRQR